MTDFSFDRSTQRYRRKSTGRFVGVAEIRTLVGKLIAQSQVKSAELVEGLLKKEINIKDWEVGMSQLIKTQAIQAAKLGKPDLTRQDYGRLGNLVKQEYIHLRKFTWDILLDGLSDAQIASRSQMYFRRANSIFERFRYHSHRDAGYRWERRHLHAQHSCINCLTYESLGWQPIGRLPAPGEACQCLSNCLCTKSYSISTHLPQESLLLNTSWGFLNDQP